MAHHHARRPARQVRGGARAALPGWALISIVEPSPHDADTLYVAATRYKHDDTAPYLYRTRDGGRSWTRITGGIPAGEFTRTIRADPARPGLLYCGTETGIYVSFDDGAAGTAWAATCRSSRSTTSSSRASRWSWRRTAARSGSWTT